MSSHRNLDTLLRVMVQLLLLSGKSCIENVALRKPAEQKSTWYYSAAGLAVDGIDRDLNKKGEGCASTANWNDTDAWWKVDLRNLYAIARITVLGKLDSYQRLRDFYIRVGNSSDIKQHADCAYKEGYAEVHMRDTFRCFSELVGSWISIQRTNDKGSNDHGRHGLLQLCEVQVYGKEKIKLPVLRWRTKNSKTTYLNTVHIIFYQFKKGTHVNPDLGDGPVGEYTVDVKEEGSSEWVEMATVKHDATKDRLNVTIAGLNDSRQYTVRVVPWYQRGDVKLKGRAEGTFTVTAFCGHPGKPMITNITAKRVTGGAEMIVRFTMLGDGHNCKHYRKVDIERRLLGTPDAPWTVYDWFKLEERRVQVFIIATKMMKKHEIWVKIYNDADKWTKSDIKIFTPVTVSPTSMSRTTSSNTMPSTTRRSDSVPKASTECPTQDMLATSPSVNDTSALKTGIIAASVILAVFLIIIIALLVYVRRLKKGTKKDPSTETGMRDVKRKHATGSQDENVRVDVPGMDGEYESVGLSPVMHHSYVNVEKNKYEILDKQQITHPSPKTYAKLGRL